MAKNFKEIEGQIEQINEPRFAKDPSPMKEMGLLVSPTNL